MPLFASLDRAKVWIDQALTAAVRDPKDAWHLGTLTYLADGPMAKTVIWRGWEARAATLRCFTDTRSGKWAALRQDPRAALLLYCPQRGVQFSAQARATLQTNTATTQALYADLSDQQRTDYQSRAAPGARNGCHTWPGAKEIDASLAARHFGLVCLELGAFDFVSLHREGHQRVAGESYGDAAGWCWRVP